MTEPSAKVIADSISPAGHRVTTMEVVMHRFVLAEFNTHRVFSRNSASSRAIPVRKQLDRVRLDPAFPVSWPEEKPGMQGGEEMADPTHVKAVWESASIDAVNIAEFLGPGAHHHLHKSVTNRLLEPFMWHTVVVTATAWENFFKQRCSPLAQPEIRVAAEAMLEAYNNSEPSPLGTGSWHLPYVDEEDEEAVEAWICATLTIDTRLLQEKVMERLAMVSAARCARVSYLTQDGKRDVAEDLALFDRLVGANPMHASPLEHVCTPDAYNVDLVGVLWGGHLVEGVRVGEKGMALTLPRYGNLLGWQQLRFRVEAEHRYQAFS